MNICSERFAIGRTIGWNKPESLAAQNILVENRKRAVKARAIAPVNWFSGQDLQLGVSQPAEVAADLEEVLAHRPADASYHVVVDLWRLAALAYHRAKRQDDKHRCQYEAAEQLAAQAKVTTCAMLASQLIGNAIAELHGVPNATEPARQVMIGHHYLSDHAFAAILQFSPFVPPDLVATFARGFMRFFQGDYTSALYILTPLLENSLRHVLKSRGHDVTIFDNATRTQQDRTISSLYEQMRSQLEAAFTRPITEDIERVFLSKSGPHLRHAVAHGMLHDRSPYGADATYACWLIFKLCLLPLFPHRKQLGLL